MKFRLQILLVVMVVLLAGCSRQASYRVLAFFFDGVPDYTKKEVSPGPDTLFGGRDAIASLTTPVPAPLPFFIHEPYETHSCGQCHDRMSSSLKIPQPQLCYTCHGDYGKQFTHQHGPVAGGHCTTCHAPHKSVLPKLLTGTDGALCLRCHVKSDILKNTAHTGHENEDCMHCHDPHGGTTRFLLK